LQASIAILYHSPSDLPTTVQQNLFRYQTTITTIGIFGIITITYLNPFKKDVGENIYKVEKENVGVILLLGLALGSIALTRYDTSIYNLIGSFMYVSQPEVLSSESIGTAFETLSNRTSMGAIIMALMITIQIIIIGLLGAFKSILITISVIFVPLVIGTKIIRIPNVFYSPFRTISNVGAISAIMLVTTNIFFLIVPALNIKSGSIGAILILAAIGPLLLMTGWGGMKIINEMNRKEVVRSPPRTPDETKSTNKQHNQKTQ